MNINLLPNKRHKKINSLKTKNPYDGIDSFIVKNNNNKLKPLISVENLGHSFKTLKKEIEIYKDINFDIYENEHLAFLGPNGSGKSTTVAMLCGIIKPRYGTIKYHYKYKNNPYEELGVQFQDLQFPNSLNAHDLIKFSIDLANLKIDQQELEEGIKCFGIDDFLYTKMSKLSGGQQQRVNVFIALLSKPKVLFLDEFTTGLDIAIKHRIQNYILNYAKKYNISLVIISHDIDTIEAIASRIIVLANKKIMVDTPKKVAISKFGSIAKLLKRYII